MTRDRSESSNTSSGTESEICQPSGLHLKKADGAQRIVRIASSECDANATLMVHCDGHRVGREELAEVGTPAPTSTWHPIPHGSLLREVEQALGRNNLRVVGEQHALGRDGERYFGLLQIANGHNPQDHAWVLGLRNSHDQTFPAGLVVGSRVFVCDNLAFLVRSSSPGATPAGSYGICPDWCSMASRN